MNIKLSDVIWTSRDGDRFWKLEEAYVRGNSIKYMTIPDEVLDMVAVEEESSRESEINIVLLGIYYTHFLVKCEACCILTHCVYLQSERRREDVAEVEEAVSVDGEKEVKEEGQVTEEDVAGDKTKRIKKLKSIYFNFKFNTIEFP